MTNTQTNPSESQSPYITAQVNHDIALYEGTVVVAKDGFTSTGTGVVRLTWLPSPEISVEFHSPEGAFNSPGGKALHRIAASHVGTIFKVPESSDGAPMHVTSSNWQSDGTCGLKGCLSAPLQRGDGQKIAKAVLHAVNMRAYKDLEGEGISRLDPTILLEDDFWHLEFEVVPDLDSIQKRAIIYLTNPMAAGLMGGHETQRIKFYYRPRDRHDAFSIYQKSAISVFGNSRCPHREHRSSSDGL